MTPHSSLSSHLLVDPDFADRFCYWRGVSGRRYIHTVYEPRRCPPLPGGIYVAVRRSGAVRLPLAVGLFSDFWEEAGTVSLRLRAHAADEIHIHLLARAPAEARTVAEDLRRAMKLPAVLHACPGLAEDERPPIRSGAKARAA